MIDILKSGYSYATFFKMYVTIFVIIKKERSIIIKFLDKKTEIAAIRIDDRLLHGIVTSMWIPRISCDRVMIIDDIVANDPIKKEIMKLSKPVNKALSIINKETAINNFKNEKYKEQRIYIITKNISVIKELMTFGFKMPTINIGMYFSKKTDYVVGKRIVVSHEELLIIKDLIDNGLKFESQYVPSDEKVNLTSKLLNM